MFLAEGPAEACTMEERIKEALAKIKHPTLKQDLISLGMFEKIEQEDDRIRLLLRTPDEDKRTQMTLEAQIRGLLKQDIPGKLVIKFRVDPSLRNEQPQEGRIPGVRTVIAVASGKGGVGKSTVAANLAISLLRKGYRVGLLDADIYGPSLGRLFGFSGKTALSGDGEKKIYPMEKFGLKLISFAFLLDPGQAVVWRGPMLGKAVEQFLYDVLWGELDYLVLDLPPGTGDVQLSLAQLISLDGAVIVTTPQNVALQDAERAINMFKQVNIPILGVIENMSEFICPACGTATHIFAQGGGDHLAAESSARFLGSVPIVKAIMESGEKGEPLVLSDPEGPVAKAFEQIALQLEVEVEKYRY